MVVKAKWCSAKRIITAIAFGVVLAPLVLSSQGASLGPGDPFTVAVNTSTIEGGPIYVAAEGPGASFRLINGGVRNLANGGAHAATNAETQMLLASTTNPKIRMLLTVAEGLYRVVAKRSAGINTVADLRGKKITTPPNTSAHYYLVRTLASAGLQESDVTLVGGPTNQMAAAVVKGDADAIVMWEPEAQNAFEALGKDAVVFQNNALYRELFSLYTTTDVLNDPRRRSELVAFVRAVIVATSNVKARPREYFPLIARTIKQAEENIAKSWEHHAFPAALPSDMLDVMTEEDQWIAKGQQRAPRTREQLAVFIETSVLRDAGRPAGR